MKTRKFLLPLALVALLLMSVSSVFAQGMDSQPCLGLEEADCELYYTFQEAGLPDSTAFDLTVAGTFSDGSEDIAFEVGATGAYVLDSAAAEAAAQAFEEIGVLDVSPRDFIELADGTVSAFDAELSLDINGIPGVTDMTGGEPFPTIDLWLVDGAAYADLSPFGMLLGDPTFAGVYGLDVFEITTTLLENVTLGDLLPDDMGMGGMDGMSMMGAQDAFTQGFNQGLATGAMMTEEDLVSFVTVERLADEEVDGMTVAVFQTTIDFEALFEMPMIREQIISSMEAQGAELPNNITADEFVDALSEAMSATTMTVTERYDTESNFLVSFDFTMDMVIDPAAFAQLDDTMTGEEQPLNIFVTVDFSRNSINQIDAIELPEGAQVVPTEALFGGMAPQS
jgi:hypothetical protein